MVSKSSASVISISFGRDCIERMHAVYRSALSAGSLVGAALKEPCIGCGGLIFFDFDFQGTALEMHKRKENADFEKVQFARLDKQNRHCERSDRNKKNITPIFHPICKKKISSGIATRCQDPSGSQQKN